MSNKNGPSRRYVNVARTSCHTKFHAVLAEITISAAATSTPRAAPHGLLLTQQQPLSRDRDEALSHYRDGNFRWIEKLVK